VAAEIWILLIVFASAAAAAAGFFYARRAAPTKAEVDALREELEASQQKAEKVQADVTGHFEQSAVLFGRLAHDYRAFLEHFSESARELGISDTMARELLQRADQPLLSSDRDIVDTQEYEDAPADDGRIGVNESAESHYSEPETIGSEDTRESVSVETTPNEETNIQQPTVQASAQSTGSETEPPLIDDVVVSKDITSDAETEPEAAFPTASKVVDVDLNPVEQDKQDTEDKDTEDTRRQG